MGPYGAFATDGAITVNIPADMPPDEVTGAWLRVQAEQKAAGPKELGKAADGTPILLVNGRFGPYVQRGPAVDGEKPPRASLAPGMTPDTVTLRTRSNSSRCRACSGTTAARKWSRRSAATVPT